MTDNPFQWYDVGELIEEREELEEEIRQSWQYAFATIEKLDAMQERKKSPWWKRLWK